MARVGPIPRYPLMAQFLLKATKEKSPYIHVYIERFMLCFQTKKQVCCHLFSCASTPPMIPWSMINDGWVLWVLIKEINDDRLMIND